jgi:hypothetical protein
MAASRSSSSRPSKPSPIALFIGEAGRRSTATPPSIGSSNTVPRGALTCASSANAVIMRTSAASMRRPSSTLANMAAQSAANVISIVDE